MLPTESDPLMPPALPGFNNIKRYYDRASKKFIAKVLPGEFYVTQQDEMISTVLGSCISACIHDTVTGIGGMNHFMLPQSAQANDSWRDTKINAALRYGNVAMEHLINIILKFGGQRSRLRLKIFGGGRIINQMTDIGKRNIDFARQFVVTEGFTIDALDVGDIYPRKVLYHPQSGKVKVKKLQSVQEFDIVEQEKAYLKRIENEPLSGGIDLF